MHVSTGKNWQEVDLSRRRLLGGAALAAGVSALIASGLAATSAAAQARISQKTVNYQTTPKGNARCDGCIQWQPPAACKIVDGAISPSGWCSVYAPKPKA
jgi:hypothetical protein